MAAVGVLLAAGAGRRMGVAKSLLRGADGRPYLDRGVRALLDGGCPSVVVILGAQAAAAMEIMDRSGLKSDPGVVAVVNESWAEGMSSSLQLALATSRRTEPEADAAIVMLVDLPDVGSDVVRRLLALAAPDALARATYAGCPGHPVLIGRDHWGRIDRDVRGDVGAKTYLEGRDVTLVRCDDLATGRDVDTPHDID